MNEVNEEELKKAFAQVAEMMYTHAKLINDLTTICQGLDTSIEELRDLYKKLAE